MINFNQGIIGQLKKVVDCKRVEGVVIDDHELSSLEDMIHEASLKEQANSNASSNAYVNGVRDSRISDANPITRQSLVNLVGEENDLLADTPVFQ